MALTPQQCLPRPWTDQRALQLYRDITGQVTEAMIDDGEDPGDTELYLLRRAQLVISLQCYIEEEQRR